MTQRVAKVESLIQQVVATAIIRELGPDAARVTVTRVDASPDLRNATVWVGLLGDEKALIAQLNDRVREIQADLAGHMKTKFVPHLHFKLDTGGAYSAQIDRLLKDL